MVTGRRSERILCFYLSHEVREEEHVGEESHPSKEVAHTQIAIVGWHA